MRVVLLREIPEDASLCQQWDLLVERVDRPQVFYTYEWALAVQRAYHATLRPLLFLAYDEQESLCGVAALAMSSAGNDISFLCATTGDYCDFLCLPQHKDAFVTQVLTELRKLGSNRTVLTNLPADSCTVAAIKQAAKQQGFYCFARTAYLCAQVWLGSVERRAGEKLVLPRKKMLRRFLNAMGREAPVRLDHARSWEIVEAILPQFIQAHVARFLVTGRISNLARSERRFFLTELARLLSGRDWLALTSMASGNKTFAWNYGFQFQGTWFWYQPTFDSSLEKYSPGFCLLAKLIEEAATDLTMQTIDLGLGAEEYKERFADRFRETLNVTLNSSFVRHVGEIVRYRAASMVKALPVLEQALRMVVARLQRVQNAFRKQDLSTTFSLIRSRLRQLIWSEDEVFFFEWSGCSLATRGLGVQPIDLNRLADAAAEYVEDRATLDYLLRSAARLRSEGAEGFALIDATGTPLCFAWTTAFAGFFLSELGAKVDAPSPDAVMLFDCWTPAALRGRGYYGEAVSLIASRVKAAGKQPWIFSAAANVSSIRGLAKSGFLRRYSLVRQRRLWRQRVKGHPPAVSAETPSTEVSARG